MWTVKENEILLDAIEKGVSVVDIINQVKGKTSRSEKAILKKLVKVGYLRRCGNPYRTKQGFVR